MPNAFFDPIFADLPTEIPLFPLEGVVLLPRGDLPLNIFHPRYLAMIEDALAAPARLIGIIQPTPQGLYGVGCAGRIIRFEETVDGRYLVTLRGLCRFRIEVQQFAVATSSYTRIIPLWEGFENDMIPTPCLDIDRAHLLKLLRGYFTRQGLTLDWEVVEEIADEGLMTNLAMICPFTPAEKQALMEQPCCKTRAGLFIKLLEMAVCLHGTDACPDKTN